MSWRRRVVPLLAVLLVGAMVATACGDGDEPAGEATTEELEFTPPPTPAVTEPAGPTGTDADAGADAGDATASPGQTTAADGSVYVVEEGDTLFEIAERFGTTVDALVEANGIDDPDTIFPGDELTIPGTATGSEPTP